MQKLLLPLVLAVLVLPSAYAENAVKAESTKSDVARVRLVEPMEALSLEAALDLAYSANPDIAVARREVQAMEGAILQAQTIPNPEVATSIEDTKQETRTTTFQLSQPLELGGKRAARVTAAQRGYDTAMLELQGKQAEVRAAVVSAFYDVVTAQERFRLAQATTELAKRATEIASKRVLAGKVSPVEETKARVAESGVRVELAQAASELQASRKRLGAMWGSADPYFDFAVNQFETLPSLPGVDELKQGLHQAPSLRRARMEVDRRQALARVELTRRVPDLTISLGVKRDEQLGRNQAIVGVSIPLPLFNRNQGNVLEAMRRTDKARDELTATEVRLNSELGQAYDRLNASRLEVGLLRQEILPGAQSAYDATTKGYELGKFNFLDVLDAQRTFFQARSQYLRALAETHRSAAEIDRIVGIPFERPNMGTVHQEQQ
ncbi:TolC family protein [Noviherbaspirillum sp. 1P10PC]|uniref:TolC family protein n=1 Tax=Noviherbaspirillum sp. 1P10PC TaxID=3132292 RepID=UPI0039A39C58